MSVFLVFLLFSSNLILYQSDLEQKFADAKAIEINNETTTNSFLSFFNIKKSETIQG